MMMTKKMEKKVKAKAHKLCVWRRIPCILSTTYMQQRRKERYFGNGRLELDRDTGTGFNVALHLELVDSRALSLNNIPKDCNVTSCVVSCWLGAHVEHGHRPFL